MADTRGMATMRQALTVDALVRFMEENAGIWSIGNLLKGRKKTMRQIYESWATKEEKDGQ